MKLRVCAKSNKRFQYYQSRSDATTNHIKLKETKIKRGFHWLLRHYIFCSPPKNALDVHYLKQSFDSIFKKLESLRCIRISLETIDERFCKWILKGFLPLECIELEAHSSLENSLNKWRTIEKYSASKVHSYRIQNNSSEKIRPKFSLSLS
jgi:hypothetical protein